ncbi:Hypothetical predicted protein [Olea europaea subsp. europaea]|uniref:Uncharacterized protein n=1 Tax=Olea europaea subsp. europaea TaxID=158383 RepID=A0A8S0UIW1_OLEEU|nr:Hypothetical predicted protein [Olea europaea subsp. europaea]
MAGAEPGRSETAASPSEKDEKSPKLVDRVKREINSYKSPSHHKETHGTSDDIDENTPVDEVKGPGIFERVKEEIEAVVQAVHPKK